MDREGFQKALKPIKARSVSERRPTGLANPFQALNEDIMVDAVCDDWKK